MKFFGKFETHIFIMFLSIYVIRHMSEKNEQMNAVALEDFAEMQD